MFKKSNKEPQLDFFGNIHSMLDASSSKQYNDSKHWHNLFRDQVFMRIDETPYRVLFSEKMGAPNASVRLLIAMMILKEAFGWSDSQLFEQCKFNLLVRASLGLFNINDAMPAASTYYLLRKKIYEYGKKEGEDLLQTTFTLITSGQIKEFDVDGRSIRMDSKLIGSNIAYYSRYEIIHQTLCKFIKTLNKKAKDKLPEADRFMMESISQEESKRTVYRSSKEEIKTRMQTIGILIYKMLKVYSGNESEAFQLLERVFNEQYKIQTDEQVELRPKEEISSGSVQSPEDPECTYRNKTGSNPVKGYSANLTETCSDIGLNLITNIEIKKANEQDNSFVKPAIHDTEEVTEQKILHAYMDGAYHSPEHQDLYDDIDVVLTGMQGYQSRYDLEMTQDGLRVTDIHSGEITMAVIVKKTKKSKQDRWRIKKGNGYYYFNEKAIIASQLRKSISNRTKEELQRRNNVEASIFQLSYHLRKDKTKYRGLIKQKIWGICRCLWINLVRIMNYIKQTYQRTPENMKNYAVSSVFIDFFSFFNFVNRKSLAQLSILRIILVFCIYACFK